jgi:DNA-binding transcriptional MerR regulator
MQRLPRNEFSAVEAAQFAKVPYASIDYWARTKLVVPSLAEAKGTGTDRRYCFSDLVALRLVKELREAGVSTQSLREVVKRVREVRNPLSECRLLTIGSTVVWIKADDDVIDVLRHPDQRLFPFTAPFTPPFTVRAVDYPLVVKAVNTAIAA